MKRSDKREEWLYETDLASASGVCLSMSDTLYSTNEREPDHRAFEPKNQFRTMMYSSRISR